MTSVQMIWAGLPDTVPETYYVERSRSYETGYGGWMWAQSTILFCPRCRAIWGGMTFKEDDDAWPRGAYCESCAIIDRWHPVPGSILLEESWGVVDSELLAALPPNLLRREFHLHLRAYERIISSPNLLEEPDQRAEDPPDGAGREREDLCSSDAS